MERKRNTRQPSILARDRAAANLRTAEREAWKKKNQMCALHGILRFRLRQGDQVVPVIHAHNRALNEVLRWSNGSEFLQRPARKTCSLKVSVVFRLHS